MPLAKLASKSNCQTFVSQLLVRSVVKIVAQVAVVSEREELLALRAEKIRLQAQVDGSSSFYCRESGG